MQNTFSRINNFCLLTLTAVALTVALVYTKAALLPFVISLLIYSVMTPLIQLQTQKLKVPRVLAICITVLAYFALTGFLVFFVSNSLEQFIRSAGAYRDKVADFIQWGAHLAESYGFEIDDRTIREEVRNIPVLSWARSFSGGVLSFVGNSILIFIFVLFLFLGDSGGKSRNQFVLQVQSKISQYIISKTIISLVTGIIVGIILLIYGVDLTFMFVVLTILLNFIPNIGSIIATLLPLPVVLMQFGFTTPTYVIFIGSTITQFTMGSILEPKVMGDSMELHPVAVLMSLIFWGLVWGIPGMFLAVPITAVLKIIFSRIEATQPLSELLSGRFPSFLEELVEPLAKKESDK